MAYKYDSGKYTKIFDEMFGQGANSSGLKEATDIGHQIGQAKLQKKLLAEQQRALEAARKEAAKLERERKLKEQKAKKDGREESALSKENENKKFRLESQGVSTEKKQSKIGKFLNLDPDNNAFFDALDLMYRPMQAINNVAKANAEIDTKYRGDDGKYSEEELSQIKKEKKNVNEFDLFMRGLKGEDRATGSDVYGASGVDNKVAKAVLGFGSDVVLDPFNFISGPLTKGIGLGVKGGAKLASKVPGVSKATDKVLDALDAAFVGKRAAQKTLAGTKSVEQGDELLKQMRQIENDRLYNLETSREAVAKSILQGGKNGAQNANTVAKVMEEPLRFGKPLDIKTAPNVLNSQSALDMMNPMLNRSTKATAPLARVADTTFNSIDEVLPNGITPNTQQRLDWGRKGFLNDTVDLGAAGRYSTKGGKVDLGVYGEYNLAPKIEAQANKILTSGGKVEEAAEILRFHPVVRQQAQTLMDSNKAVREYAMNNGIDIPELEGYMAHFLTEEATKFVREGGDIVSDGRAAVGGNKKVTKRELKDSVTNVNVKMKRDKGIDFDWFTNNAFLATAGGQQKFINYIAKETALDTVLKNSSIARELPAGIKPRPGTVKKNIRGKDYELTKWANEAITNFERKTEDDAIKGFWKGFDKVQNMWKKTALFNLGFHARSIAGNNFNMYIAGMRPDELAQYQAKAMYALDNVNARRVGKNIGKSGAIDKAYDMFIRQGLKGTGSTADFMDDAGRAVMSEVEYKTKGIAGKILHPLSQIGKEQGAWNKTKAAVDAPFASSRAIGDKIDETSRFAMFMWGLNKFDGDAVKAAEKVREALFDYTQLTNFERQGMKRAAPFYTFLRKNAEFQMKAFATNPERYERINALYQNAEANVDMNMDIMPDYMKDNMALPIPGTDKLLSLNPPSSDLAKWTNPGKVALDSLSPLIKAPMELAMNEKTFNGAPISTFDTQKGKLLGKEFEGIPLLPDGEKSLGMNGKEWQYLLESLVSPVRNISGSIEKQDAGNSVPEAAMNALGLNVLKQWDQEGFQRDADYKEKERLDSLINDVQKDQGIDLSTINELKKQGVYQPDDHRAAAAAKLAELGYSQKQADMLISLKNKVYNNDGEYAAKTAQMLQQMGLPPEVIKLITSDFLDY